MTSLVWTHAVLMQYTGMSFLTDTPSFKSDFFSQILGGILLAAGIIAELQKEDYGDVSSSVLGSPAIICITIGSILFLLGLLGSVGALVELYYVLIIVSDHSTWIMYCLYAVLFPLVCTTAWYNTIDWNWDCSIHFYPSWGGILYARCNFTRGSQHLRTLVHYLRNPIRKIQ